jgi:Tfp pilus assembly protein PilF
MTGFRSALLLALAGVLLVAGCSSNSVRQVKTLFQGNAERTLSLGLDQYEDGNYAEATRNLQSALEQGLNANKDRVEAYKHLAFIQCASGRERQCREEFRRALEVDPSMDLRPAEAGHPSWGPVFRSVKGRR